MKKAQRGAQYERFTAASNGQRFNRQDDLERDYLDDDNVDAEGLNKLIEIGEGANRDDSLDGAQLRDELGIKIDREEDG